MNKTTSKRHYFHDMMLHNYVQYNGICLSLRVLENMSLCITADNFVCLLRQLIEWRFNSRKLVEYTHTKSSRKLYDSQLKLYDITETVEYKNKSAYTEMSRTQTSD
jgi:hypothetical protein